MGHHLKIITEFREVWWTDQNNKSMLFISFNVEQYSDCCMDSLV